MLQDNLTLWIQHLSDLTGHPKFKVKAPLFAVGADSTEHASRVWHLRSWCRKRPRSMRTLQNARPACRTGRNI